MFAGLHRATVTAIAVMFVAFAAALAEGAENTPIQTCVNRATGDVRIVSDASQCRLNEDPIQLASADPQQVWSKLLASADSASSELTVPDLGTFTLVCQSIPAAPLGFAFVKLTTSAPIRMTIRNPDGSGSSSPHAAGVEISLLGSGFVLTDHWFSGAAAAWKLDALVLPSISTTPCSLAVIVTRVE